MNPEVEAWLCAKASAAIYAMTSDEGGSASCQASIAHLGFRHFVPFQLPTLYQDFCAFFAASDEYNLLAFRGTQKPIDWMTDAECVPIAFEAVFVGSPVLGNIHTGFGRCLVEGLRRLEIPLKSANHNKPLLITGHSLGGALAALSAICLTVSNAPIPPLAAIYTFGQPRIGLQPFCDEYRHKLAKKLVRFVNNQDIVPRVPPRFLGYVDAGTMVHFDSFGKPSLEAAEWSNRLNTPYSSVMQIVEMINNARVDIGEHSMASYLPLIEANQQILGELLPTVFGT